MTTSLKQLHLLFSNFMWHDQTTGLKNEKIQCDRESKLATSAKNSKTNEINFFSPEQLGIFV